MRVYIGTQGTSLFAARLDEDSGELTGLGPVAEVERPTFVLADPARRVLYAVSEVGNAGEREAEVLSFVPGAADASLVALSRVSSGGGGATHLALHPAGASLFVANFGGGQAAALPVGTDGVLAPAWSVQATHGSGPHRRQSGPHPHGVTPDPSGGFLLVPDMGADRVFVYRHDGDTGTLSPATPAFAQLPAGSGPRLLLFAPDGRFAFLLTELSAEIFVFRWDALEGRLEAIDSLALDEDGPLDGRSAAGLALSRDGRHLYASNRRTATLHVHAIDADTGRLSRVQAVAAGGERPWSADLSPDGRWMLVANQASGNVRVFAVDARTGGLSPVPGGIDVPAPTSVALVG